MGRAARNPRISKRSSVGRVEREEKEVFVEDPEEGEDRATGREWKMVREGGRRANAARWVPTRESLFWRRRSFN